MHALHNAIVAAPQAQHLEMPLKNTSVHFPIIHKGSYLFQDELNLGDGVACIGDYVVFQKE